MKENARKFGPIVLPILLLAGLIWAGKSFWYSQGHVVTDDAFFESHVIQVGPKISEKVLKVHVDDNQSVRKGDLLVELDPRDTQAIVNQAQANLESAKAKCEEAQAQLASSQANQAQAIADVNESMALATNAGQESQRSQSLKKSGAIAQREFDQVMASALSTNAALASKQQKARAAESNVHVATASVASARAQVDLAKALLETARLRLENTKILAPGSGRITRKNVEIGQYVQPGNALMAIVEPDVWVLANFKETQLSRMRPGQPVDIHVDSYPNLNLTGTVESIQAGTGSRFSLLPPENATGNFVKVVQRVPVKIVLKIPKDCPLLAPGMSVIPSVNVR